MTYYWVNNGGNWSDFANHWATTSGGSTFHTVAPTAADDVVFDENSGSGTIVIDTTANCKHFTASNLAGAITLSSSANNINIYGSLTLPATNFTWTFTGTAYTYLRATTSETLTMGATSGRSFNRLYFDGVGGTWTNQDGMNVGYCLLGLTNGHWNTNSKNITTTNNYVSGVGTKTLSLGSSIFTVNQFFADSIINFTLNAGTSTIVINGNTFNTHAKTFYNVILNYNSIVSFVYGGTIYNLTLNNVLACNFNTGNIVTITNNLTLNGVNSSNNRLLITSNIIGTPRTITCNGSIVASNVDFRDITLAGTANRDLSAIDGGSGDCGGNSGITFTPAAPQYYKHTGGGTTLWSDATKWFSDTALTVAGRVPLPQDDATFLAGSFDTACTLSVNVPRIGRSLDMSAVSVAVNQSLANAIECYGSYVLGSNITPSGNFNLSLMGRGDFNLNSYIRPIHTLQINSFSGEYISLSDITLYGLGLFAISGSFDANDFGVKITGPGFFNLQNTFILKMGNGLWEHTNSIGYGGNFWVSTGSTIISEGSTLRFNILTTAINMPFRTNGKTFNKVQFSGTHTGNFDIIGSNTIAELIIDKGRKVRLTAGTTQTIGKITANGTVTEPIELGSTTAATATINYNGADKALVRNVKFTNILSPTQPIYNVDGVDGGGNSNIKYLYALAPKTMGFPIRFVKD